jgi:hypothetical protein
MKTLTASIVIVGMIATVAAAAAPAGAPAGSMGLCNDGTYSNSPEKRGACGGHKGVKEWFEENSSAKSAMSERAAPPAASSTTTAPSQRPPSPAVAGRTSGPATEPAAGGGAGKVWVNTSTKVYHCSGDKYYGKTKHGEYLSEADAKGKGYHADHGKACA